MTDETDFTRLSRCVQSMPESVRQALEGHELMEAYRRRPAYQQNDYLLWINQAKREETKQRRIKQMLQELTAGDLYMKMRWNPKR